MLIVFRTDADPAIGGGHVMRCLTLAAEMQRRGADVIFISKEGTPETVPALVRSGIASLTADRDDWNDAIAAGKFGAKQVSLIVVDSYDLGEAFERSLRRHACPIAVIDDVPVRRHDCDLLIDTTLNRVAADYMGLVPGHCRVLAGCSYAPLRSAFAELRNKSVSRRQASPTLKSLFVSLGFTDIGGQTAAIARSLAGDGGFQRIVVVTGPKVPALHEITGLPSEAPLVEVHVDPANIAELMADSDLAIGTPGTSSWERCCLGLPSVLLVVAQNQKDNAEALERAGAARILAPRLDVSSTVRDIIRELRNAPDQLVQMSQRAAEICDGDGAFRICNAIDELILPVRTRKLTLRPATEEDSRRLWLWRNDPTARAMFKNQQPVPWETHCEWLAARLSDAGTLIFIVEADGRPCGSVRFHSELTRTASVSIAMARHVRGLGYGAAALSLACQQVFRQRFCDRIEARVKHENFASQRIFLKSGFVPAEDDAGYRVYYLGHDAVAKTDDKIAGHAR
jgi:UDP-2,4-diacetamido-2,4,6-trideoxy-beta-L-altropyranose hydrolase